MVIPYASCVDDEDAEGALKIGHRLADNEVMASVRGGIVGQIGGKLAGAVLVRLPDGQAYLREHVLPRNPRTPAQIEARNRYGRAMQAYRDLGAAEMAAWQAYAEGLARDGERSPRAVEVFVALATKLLQALPDAVVPTLPPDSPFVGDGVNVGPSAGVGAVVFAPDAANREGVVTELLLAPMRSAGTRPNAHAYRHRAFVAFSGPGEAFSVSAGLGWWACAVRFVRLSTGQATPLVRIGAVRTE